MEDKVKKGTPAPYVIQAGPEESRQFFVIAENEIFCEIPDILKAVATLLAVYYVFDIVYPKKWSSCLLFVEKKVFGIKDGPNLSQLQAGLISDIESLS